MGVIQSARVKARTEITAAIKDEARRQLAEQGAAKLSLRAVARELGVASSALYRYFPSYDSLLTALIIDAYDSMGRSAEAAAEAVAGAPALERWVTVCGAVREWGLAHVHEYALIYGSPVPGYVAPRTTVPAAARVGAVLLGIVREAHRESALSAAELPDELRGEAARMAAELAPDLAPEVVAVLVAAWAQLYGLVGFELFGQFTAVVEDREPFFRHAAARLGAGIGLTG